MERKVVLVNPSFPRAVWIFEVRDGDRVIFTTSNRAEAERVAGEGK